jgi:hypothetical protein
MHADPMHCGKRAYGSEREARDVADHQMSLGAPDLETYHCLDCGFFHLTSAPRPSSKRERRGRR